jgi:hypothetical protein
VPARAVEHERDMLVLSDRPGEGREDRLHAYAVRLR